jgi:hypothetical protein
VSASSFKIGLLRPAVEIVIVVYRLVARATSDGSDVPVEWIRPERDRFAFVGPAEVAVDRFPDHRSNADAAPRRLITELAIDLLGEAKIRDHITNGHGGITISRYRQCGKWRPDPIHFFSAAVQFSTTLIGEAPASARSADTRNRFPSVVGT